MRILAALTLLLAISLTVWAKPGPGAGPTFEKNVGPFMKKYCLGCHTGQYASDGVDLSKIKSAADAKKSMRLMKKAAREVSGKAMPPKTAMQPTDAERKAFKEWISKLK